jgi:hypothetical protein
MNNAVEFSDVDKNIVMAVGVTANLPPASTIFDGRQASPRRQFFAWLCK